METSRATDDEHLRLLAIFHYVVAAITAVFGCFPLMHVALGLFITFAPEAMKNNQGESPPDWFGLIFVFVGGMLITIFWSLAACIAFAGHCLAMRKYYMFCLVVAALECMFTPFGTVLGVFSIIVLMRDSVKQSFATGKLPLSTETAGGPVA